MPNFLNILVVDDDAPLLNAVELVLAKRGHEVIKVSNARNALRLMATLKVDVIVSDIIMPDMDGLAFVSEIRKRSKTIPVLMLSADTDLETVKQAAKLGANGYLMKPFDSDKLVRKVESLADVSLA
jgi:DNA-binding response OmpR family regulator